MSALMRTLWRKARYEDGPSWFERHPLPEGWRPDEPEPAWPAWSDLPVAAPPPVGEWQWVVADARGRVVDGGVMACDLGDPQQVAYEAMEAFLAGRGMPTHEAHGLLCAARLADDPGVVGVVDGRDW